MGPFAVRAACAIIVPDQLPTRWSHFPMHPRIRHQCVQVHALVLSEAAEHFEQASLASLNPRPVPTDTAAVGCSMLSPALAERMQQALSQQDGPPVWQKPSRSPSPGKASRSWLLSRQGMHNSLVPGSSGGEELA